MTESDLAALCLEIRNVITDSEKQLDRIVDALAEQRCPLRCGQLIAHTNPRNRRKTYYTVTARIYGHLCKPSNGGATVHWNVSILHTDRNKRQIGGSRVLQESTWATGNWAIVKE